MQILHIFEFSQAKGGFKSEDTGEVLHLQHKYSIPLSWTENLNFLPKKVNNLFKFSAQAINSGIFMLET